MTSTWRGATPTPTATRTSLPAHRRPAACPQPRPRAGRRRPALLVADRPVPAARPRRAAGASPARRPGSAGCWAASRPASRVGALSGSRREAVDLGIALGGELGSALAGVRLDVQGAEHLATRPAVFLFNHQSQLDVLVLSKLLRGGFTAVAKKGLENTPGFGLVFRLADVAFVDRGDPAQARRGPGAGGAAPARRDLAGHRAGGHPVGHADPRPVQEGRVPRRDAGRRPDRPRRDPQRRRADVARGDDDPVGHGAGARAPADPHRRLDGRGARRAGRRGPRPVPGDPGELVGPRPPGRRHRGERRRRDGRAPGRPARLGHGGGDEPPRDGDVAGGGRGPEAAGQRHAAGAAGPRPRLGPPARRARVGLPDGPAHAAARAGAGAGRRRAALGDRGRAGPRPARAAGPPRGARVDAAAARRRRRVRERPARPGPAAVGGAPRRGSRRRPGRLRGQDPPQHDRRHGRRPADEPAAQPDPRPRPDAARAPGPAGRRRLARRRAHRAARRHGARGPAGGAAPRRRRRRQLPAPPLGHRDAGARRRPGGRPHPRAAARRRVGAALRPRRRLALRGAGGVARRPQGRREGGRRIPQRRLPRRGDRRVPALPRAARRTGGLADARHPDQPARPGRPAGRQPLHRRPLPRPADRDRCRHPDPDGPGVRPLGAGRRRVRHRQRPARPGARLGARAGHRRRLGLADQRQRRPGVEHAGRRPARSTSPGRASCGCTPSVRSPAAAR